MTESFQNALINVWRQVLIEDAKAVELGAERFPVRQTTKSRLRQVDFVFEGNKFRGVEQNSKNEVWMSPDVTIRPERGCSFSVKGGLRLRPESSPALRTGNLLGSVIHQDHCTTFVEY
jgi:hypothetical protein